LSPHYRDQHADWIAGTSTQFGKPAVGAAPDTPHDGGQFPKDGEVVCPGTKPEDRSDLD
jgi:hypothetical protein